MSELTKLARNTLLLLGSGALLGLGLAALEPGPLNSASISAYGSLAAILLLAGWIIWRQLARDSKIGWLAVAAFLLRLVLGVALALLLPTFGYDTPPQNNGYIFLDAYQRDTQAWQLAQSGAPLATAINGEFFTDQYGGMLISSAGMYRIFSPDLHRPWLILLLTAFVAAVGVIFLYKALDRRFGAKTATLAAWIYVLYPEVVLLGASQMRDPILMGLTAVSLYYISLWRDLRGKALIGVAISFILLAAFSWLVLVGVAAVLVIWWWIDYSADLADRRRRLMGWAFLSLLLIAGFTFTSNWLRASAGWDLSQTITDSGWIQAIFEHLPAGLQKPFVVVYGLLQPVLPAALFDPSVPIWTTITSIRSAGWYAVIPILFYAPIALWKTPRGTERRLLAVSLGAVAVWTVISSLRAGGDLWDNPRYRTLFIPWISLVAAWAWNTAREHRDGWLARWYGVIGVFLVFFTNWYLYRKIGIGILIDFWLMILLIVLLSLMVLGWGVVQEIRQRGNPFTIT